ncbi:MAG: hypothetical protein WB783_03630 [Arenicellales bacterium]
MIPLLATVRIAKQSGKGPRLWVPLFLVWLLLAPLVLVLLPVAFVACLIARINPFRAFAAIWSCFVALRGTRIEVDTSGKSVLIHVF